MVAEFAWRPAHQAVLGAIPAEGGDGEHLGDDVDGQDLDGGDR